MNDCCIQHPTDSIASDLKICPFSFAENWSEDDNGEKTNKNSNLPSEYGEPNPGVSSASLTQCSISRQKYQIQPQEIKTGLLSSELSK